jgi:hypothetical protein
MRGKHRKIPKCRYCKVFQEATIKRWYPDEHNNPIKQRYCGKKKEYVHLTHEGCPDAIILDTNLFYCERNNHFQYIKVCFHLRLEHTEGCINCRQGKDLAEIRRSIRTKPTLIKREIKPTLIRRIIPEEKPTLIKRVIKPTLIRRTK